MEKDTKEKHLKTMDVDRMLAFAGDFGPYQFILLALFSLINILSAFHYFAQTFISVVPDYRCNSFNTIDNSSQMRTLTEPETKLLRLFDRNSSSLFSEIEISNANADFYKCSTLDNPSEPCSNGWNYTLSYGYSSIVDELNWICDDAWKPVLGQSLFFIGSVIGSMILGIMADHIGRLHVLVLANMFAMCGNLITMFASSLLVFAMGRLIAGIATDSNFVMMYIIVMEYIRPSMRTFGLNICIGLFYCIGCMVVPWIAVLTKTWRLFLLVVTLPLLSTLLFYCIVPESAQWLISTKRTDDAIKCFRRIAQMNRKVIPDTAIDDLKEYCENHIDQKKSGNLLGLFKTPCLRRKTLILIFKSMVITLCYDAISRNINGLGFSPFIMFSITSGTILPACILILFLQDIVGRKAMACVSLFISGIFTSTAGIILATIHKPDAYLTLLLSIIARFGINVAYNSGAQYAVELIPTEVRGQGVALVHVAGYAATFFSSHILYLGEFNRALPELILGFLSMMGAIACLFLPETLNRTLPVTLADGEKFGENEAVFEFACCNRKSTESTLQLVEDNLEQNKRYQSTSISSGQQSGVKPSTKA